MPVRSMRAQVGSMTRFEAADLQIIAIRRNRNCAAFARRPKPRAAVLQAFDDFGVRMSERAWVSRRNDRVLWLHARQPSGGG